MLSTTYRFLKKIHWGIKLSLFAIVFSFLAFTTTEEGDKHFFEIAKNLDIFTSVYRELNIYYVDETDPGKLMNVGIDAMLQSLDPYTNYYPESEIEDYRFMTTGQYGGIGAMIRTKDDDIVISEPYEGFPAHKAGLKAGDLVLEVDGNSVKGKNSSELSDLLKGQPGTAVKLTIQRPGTPDNLEVELVREEIQVSSVPYYGMLDDKVGYIKLNSFTDKAGRDVKSALLELKKIEGLEGVVLDLRGNPGGLLRESIKIVNFFTKKGQEVVSTKGKVRDWDKIYKGLNVPVDKELGVAVLIDGGSASASEIVSGSLQDLDRAVIIGQKSFGKGLVQTTRPLSYNTRLKVTTAKYYTPSGRCIQAIDYSNRDEEGKVSKVPDSLITEYKTANGRLVYDGEGITPDVKIEAKFIANVSIALARNNLMFDFATEYCLKNPTIAEPAKFKLTESDWNDFKMFLNDKEYKYETKSELALEKLKKSAEKEAYFEKFETEFNVLKSKMENTKGSDLDDAKEEIVLMLTREIVGRYYYQKGKIKYSLTEDEEVAKAIEILSDKAKINAVLGPQ